MMVDGDRRAGPPAPARGLTRRRVLLWCVWAGPVFTLLLFGALLLIGWVPPPSPSQSAEQVAAMYREHTDLKRLAFLLVLIAGTISAPFVIAIGSQLERIPGARPMAQMQLVGGALGVLAVVGPTIVFMAAAYEPGRDPQVTEALHDLAFIPFIGNFSTVLIQCAAIGVAVLMQDPEDPLIPRWVGFFNLWACVSFLPGGLLIFFHDGALAWNGAIVFWVVAVLFGAWFWVMFWAIRRAILREDRPGTVDPSWVGAVRPGGAR